MDRWRERQFSDNVEINDSTDYTQTIHRQKLKEKKLVSGICMFLLLIW